MFRFHTEATADWAVRMVKPIEDWLNYRCPIVPRRWLNTERRLRWNAEYDRDQQRAMFERDIDLLAESIDIPEFTVTADMVIDQVLLTEDLKIEMKPFHRFYRLRDPLLSSVHELSPVGIDLIIADVTRRVASHAQQNLAEGLARIQMQEAA